jgi:hypothetical protein
MIVPLYLISFSMSIAKAQDQNQALKELENVNVTSSDTGGVRTNTRYCRQSDATTKSPTPHATFTANGSTYDTPPSTPRYQIPHHAESNYQPAVILSQSLYFNKSQNQQTL